MMKKLLPFFSIVISFFYFLSVATIPVSAEVTITINGNGTESSNQVSVETKTEESISQSNDTRIENTVEQHSDTGGNQANNNTGGEVTIETGDVVHETVIVNQDINQNQVDVCCQDNGGVNIDITGNGSDSTNTAAVNQRPTTTVNQVNTAHIENHVNTSADTGNNQVNNNTGGDTSIHTGNIQTTNHVTNQNINHNSAQVPRGINAPNYVNISSNGSGSTTTITINQGGDVSVKQINNNNIDSILNQAFNTGNNQANNNTGGEVTIVTGTVLSDATILNQDININQIDSCCDGDDCCNDGDCDDDDDCNDGDCDDDDDCNDGDCDHDHHHCHGGDCHSHDPHDHEHDHEDYTNKIIEKTAETITKYYYYNYAPASIGRGGLVLGAMLPATGSSNQIYWLIANMLTFLMGAFIRLKSGRSPAVVQN